MRRLLGSLRTLARGPTGAREPLPPVRAAFIVRDNFRQRRSIERSYVQAIGRARQRVDLVSPYFYPGRAFMRALRRAARRGVRVRLLTQGRWDYRFAEIAARAVYAELIRRGVRIYEYTPAFLHAKVAVVDDTWATVGSSNIDPLSLLVNLEANVVVDDVPFVSGLAAEIDAAIAVSREITPAAAVSGANWLRRVFVAWVARVYMRLSGASGRY
jgi:cardiolipin synthase